MNKISIIAILATTLLVAGILIAGCTQDSGTTGPVSPGDSQQNSVSNGAGSSPAGNDGSSMSGPGGSRQFRGQNFLTNETLLSSAAGKLGIPEQDLKNALSSTTNSTGGRPNFTAAAQQLGITQQQLTDAFGLPAGGYRGGRSNVSTVPGT